MPGSILGDVETSGEQQHVFSLMDLKFKQGKTDNKPLTEIISYFDGVEKNIRKDTNCEGTLFLRQGSQESLST